MRIVAGSLRGRRFNPPESFDARPTTDFARENLFNVLNNIVDYQELRVLDLFSGSGAISYEFASRGCTDIVSVEKDFQHQRFIVKTIEAFGIKNAVKSIKGDAIQYASSTDQVFNLIFADPPYALKEVDLLPDIILTRPILSDDGFFILEHSGAGRFNNHPNFWQTREYGKVNFTFFRKNYL